MNSEQPFDSMSQSSSEKQSAVKPGKGKAKKGKRAKNPKSIHQIIVLKYFYHLMESCPNKRGVVESLQKHTGFSQRQIYKWMWDETLRSKQRSPEQNEQFKKENVAAFSKVMDSFTEQFGTTANYVLNTIFVPANSQLSEENNQLVWKMKLKGINNDIILLRQQKATKEN